jgi:hypothetical protein
LRARVSKGDVDLRSLAQLPRQRVLAQHTQMTDPDIQFHCGSFVWPVPRSPLEPTGISVLISLSISSCSTRAAKRSGTGAFTASYSARNRRPIARSDCLL